MTSKNSFLADLASNNKRRKWNIALFVVMLLIIYPLALSLFLRADFYNGYDPSEIAKNLISTYNRYMCFSAMGIIVATLFAAIAAIHGFSFLYSQKKIDMYMSIPVSKKRQFAIIYVNGILMYCIPLAVSFFLCVLIGKSFGAAQSEAIKLTVMTFAINCLYYFAVYNVVLIAQMLTGNVVVTVLGALVLLFYENGVKILVLGYFRQFFNSYSKYSDDMLLKTLLSPIGIIISLFTKANVNADETVAKASQVFGAISFSVCHLTVVSILFLIIAFVLYMKRPMESCSKAMSFRKTKTTIKRLIIVPAALFTGLCFCMSTGNKNDVPVMLLGLAIGTVLCHCVIEMIYEFDIGAVFKDKRSIIYCLVAAGIIFAIFNFDIFGYNKFVPASEKVESAGIFVNYYNSYQNNFNEKNSNNMDESARLVRNMNVTDTALITDIAKAGVENMKNKESDSDSTYADIAFRMKNGKIVYRQYTLSYTKNRDVFNRLFADSNYKEVLNGLNSNSIKNNLDKAQLVFSNGVAEQDIMIPAGKFLDVYKKDYNNMTFDDAYNTVPIGIINVEINSQTNQRTVAYPLYESYKETIALMKSSGVEAGSHISPDNISSIVMNNYMLQGKGENGVLDKTYTDPAQISEICAGIVPTNVVGYGYVYSSRFYNNCGAVVNFKNNIFGYSANVVDCSILRDGLPDYVKADIQIEDTGNGETDNKQTAADSAVMRGVTTVGSVLGTNN